MTDDRLVALVYHIATSRSKESKKYDLGDTATGTVRFPFFAWAERTAQTTTKYGTKSDGRRDHD